MLILDGLDGLGKTTAAQTLVRLANEVGIDAEYRHMSRPAADFDFHQGYKPMINERYVQDRFHYGALLWHHDVMTDMAWADIEDWLKGAGCVKVLFKTSNQAWYRRHIAEHAHKQLFSIDALIAANTMLWALPADFHVVVDGPNDFVGTDTLHIWLELWRARRFTARMMR